MNSKADKIKLEWPPFLNLSNDKPHIDSSYRNVEKNNSVYLNGMLQPLYKKRNYGYSTVYDKSGKRYTLIPNATKVDLYVDEEKERSFTNKKFVKEDLIDRIKSLLNGRSFDPGEIVTLAVADSETYIGISIKELQGTYGAYKRYYAFRVKRNSYEEWQIERSTTGDVVEARCIRIDGTDYFIIYDDYLDAELLYVFRLRSNGNTKQMTVSVSSWWRQTAAIGDETKPKFERVYSATHNPIIHIAKASTGDVYISLTNSTGEVLNGFETVFETFLVGEEHLIEMTDFDIQHIKSISNSGTTSTRVHVNVGQSTSQTNRTVVKYGNRYFVYQATATALSQLTELFDIPSDYTFTSRSMKQTLTDDIGNYSNPPQVQVDVLSFVEYVKTYTLQVTGNSSQYYLINGRFEIANANYDAPRVGNNNAIQPPEMLEDGTFDNGSYSSGTYRFRGLMNKRTKGSGRIRFNYKYYSHQPIPNIQFTSGELYLYDDLEQANGAQATIRKSDTNTQEGIEVHISDTSISEPQNSATVPCIILDDGKFYSVFNIGWLPSNIDTTTVNVWEANRSKFDSVALSADNGEYELDSQRPDLYGKLHFYYVNSTPTLVTDVIRGTSFVVDQNFYVNTLKLNNASAASPASSSETSTSLYVESAYSNASSCIRWGQGTVRKSDFNYYSQLLLNAPNSAGYTEDLLTFTAGGFRVSIPNSKFNLLYNVALSGYSTIQGISYSASDTSLGTLLTPWQSIENGSFISATNTEVVYKNKDGKWKSIRIEDGAYLSTILDDRCILVNTIDSVNLYDTEKDKWYNYANDYNDRIRYGSKKYTTFSGVIPTSTTGFDSFYYMRYTASAINPLYEVMPRDIVTSVINPILPKYRCLIGEETIDSSFGLVNQYISVFYSDYENSICKYRESIRNWSHIVDSTLLGLNYPGNSSTSAILTPNIFTKYMNGAGNNDVVLEDYDAYSLTYYDNQPFLIYSATTQVSNLYTEENSFFVLQGQYYGIIGNKLYSLLYSNGSISAMDAIIDLGSLQFIGNNPMIAFFYDPATRVIRSFTGDANLDFLYSATKISKFYGSWYDETTQSIWTYTNAGLLVFGSKNLFLLEHPENVSLIQFSNDGKTHVIGDEYDETYAYYEEDGFNVIPIELETSFYGLGATESTTIDRWNITLYDLNGNHPAVDVMLSVRSITDVTVKSEEKKFSIKPEMYDKWSNSVLLSYSPKLIKGQGIRLSIKTPLTIQSIVPHIMDNKTGTVTRREM